jgi:hypothetical protein
LSRVAATSEEEEEASELDLEVKEDTIAEGPHPRRSLPWLDLSRDGFGCCPRHLATELRTRTQIPCRALGPTRIWHGAGREGTRCHLLEKPHLPEEDPAVGGRKRRGCAATSRRFHGRSKEIQPPERTKGWSHGGREGCRHC